MQIVALADEGSKEEFMAKTRSVEMETVFTEDLVTLLNYPSADAFFILKEDVKIEDPAAFRGKPVFINSIITLKEMELPDNFSRINGWPGFLNRELWEVAGMNEAAAELFEKLKWKYTRVADEPGLVSARVISMIINEAYFALGEEVSSKTEIDLAMKLGTNYPYGPFEWGELIGLKKINSLLEKLNSTSDDYLVAPALKKDLLNKM